ncbi:MAG: glycosyltransferase [Candidatus Kapabacteria bacterium]|nr:glycosyltransferase [Candidatus Kapabacteria bacterium]
MRILTLLPRIPIPARDGGALALLGAVSQLHAAGHHVDVFVLNTSRHHQDPAVLRDVCSNITAVDIDTSVTALGAFRNLVAPRRSGSGGWSFRGRSVPLSYWLERFVHDAAFHALETLLRERPPYDVIVCESLFTAPYGFDILRMMHDGEIDRRPVVLRAHNVEYKIQERMAAERSRPLPERLYRRFLAHRTRRFEREVAQSFDGVNTMTTTDADEFTRLVPSVNVHTIAPGVTMPDATYLERVPAPHTLCLLGSLEWAPNVQGALWFLDNVMPRILREIPDAVVHVGGRGRDASVEARHNGASIIVHGEVDDALAFRADAAVSIVPLFSGSGIRIKIQEAMSLARPVVSTTLGADGIPAIDGEHFLLADDADAFAQACVRLLRDADAAHAMGQRARRFAEQYYGWQQVIEAVVPWYQTLAQRRAGAADAD